MSSPPVKYLRYFDFTTFATLNPEKPLPGNSVDAEYNRLKTTTDQTIDRLALLQNDDGTLKGTIGTAQLLDGAVTEPKLATGAVSTRALGDGQVTTPKLGFASVDNTKLAIDAVTTSIIKDLQVTTPKIADGAVTGPKIAPGSVNGAALAPGSIGSAQIQDGSIQTVDLADLSVTTPKLADGSVTTSKIAPGTVIPGGIPPGYIDNVMMGPLSVGTANLIDASVTLAKLAPNSVDSSKIVNGTIDPADLNGATIALMTAAGNPRGAWATGTNYATKDAVTNGSGVFVAIAAHVSGVFATDLAAGKWYQTGQVFDQTLNKADTVQFAGFNVELNTNGPSASYHINRDLGAGARSGWLAFNNVSYGGVLHYGQNYAPAAGDSGGPNKTVLIGGSGGLAHESPVTMEWWVAQKKVMTLSPAGALVTANLPAPNKIINGDFRVDQRYNHGPMAPNGNAFGPDCWALLLTQAGKLQAQAVNSPSLIGQNQSPLPGTFWRITPVGGAPVVGAADSFGFFHTVEGSDCVDTCWSALSGRPVTLSFWVESTVPGTYGGALRNHGYYNRCYPFKYTINAANTWQKIEIVIPAPAQGTNWNLDSLGCMSFVWCLGAGATNTSVGVFAWENGGFHTPPGCLNLMATQAASFDITGVKLELGSVATPFAVEPITQSIARCQRRYHTDGGFIYHSVIMDGNSGEVPSMFVELPVTMRSTPSVVFNGVSNIFFNNGSGEDFFVPAGGTPAFGGNYKSGLARIDNISNPKGAAHAGKCGMWLTNLAFSADI